MGDYTSINHSVQKTTSRRSVFEEFRHSERIFVSLKSGMDNLDIQELIAEADRIIANKLLPAKSRQRYEGVCVCVCVRARACVGADVIYFLIFTNYASFRDKICS